MAHSSNTAFVVLILTLSLYAMGAIVKPSSTPRAIQDAGSMHLNNSLRMIEMKCYISHRTCTNTALPVHEREYGCDDCDAECRVPKTMPGVSESFLSKLATKLKYCVRRVSRNRKIANCETKWKICQTTPTKAHCAACAKICRSALNGCPSSISALKTYEKKRDYCTTKSDFFDINIDAGVEEINRPFPQKQDLKEQHEWESKYCASIAPSDPATVTPSPTISVTPTPSVSPGIPLVGNENYPFDANEFCPGQALGWESANR